MSNDVEQIPVAIADRKWMAHKSWRVYLSLPANNSLLPVQLTALIDRNVNLVIENQESRIEIKPCHVVNVPSKGKKFLLVIETCYEHQNLMVGPQITGMLGEDAVLSIWPVSSDTPSPKATKEPKKEPVSEERRRTLFGFHRLFTVPRFWEFIGYTTGKTAKDEQTCVTIFREYLKIQSRSELSDEQIADIRNDFNEWLTKGRT